MVHPAATMPTPKEKPFMTTIRTLVPRSVSTLSCLALASAASLAQTAAPPVPADAPVLIAQAGSAAPATAATPVAASDATKPQVVTVTSRRRLESIQEVPQSITAISAAQIRQEGATDLKDLGFSIGNYSSDAAYGNPARSTPVIRGVANSSGGGNGGTSAVYIDDVYIGDTSGNALSLMDVERVEVLRGPQGTLFGKNSISGAVNVTTMRPSKQFDGAVSLAIGNFGLVQPGVYLSGPLVPDLLYGKIAAMGTKRDGFDKVASTGEKVNTVKNQSVRAGLLITPTRSTDVSLNFDATEDTSSFGYADVLRDRIPTGPAYGATLNVPGVPFPLYRGRYNAGIAARDGNTTDGVIPGNTPGKPNTSKLEITGGSLKVDHRWDGLQFLSITASRKYKSASKADGDNGPLDLFYSDNTSTYKQASQEFRLIGQSAGFDWVAGLFYFKGERDVSRVTNVGQDFLNDARLVNPGLGGFFFTTGAAARALCPGGGAIGSSAVCSAAQFEPDFRKNTSTAAYGSVSYKIDAAFSLTGGLRYNREQLDQRYIPAYTIAPFFGLNGVPAVNAVSKSETDTSPSLSLAYKLDKDVNLYANYGKGYRSGFVNASDGKVVKPEVIQSYEIGAKSVWLDGKATTNVAVYRMDYTDLQRTRALNFGQQFVTDNAAKATIQGLELDASLRAFAGLDLTLSAGFNDAKYKSYTGARITLDDGSSSLADLSGARMLFAPKSTVALGARYNMDVAGFGTEFGGQVQNRSAFQVGDGPATIFKVNSQTNVNLFASLSPQQGSWKATVRVKNLSGKRYYLGPNQSADGTDYAVLSEPRTVTLDMRWDF
jgi:iron complex outermembrane recepter protein